MRILLMIVATAAVACGQTSSDSQPLGDVARAYRFQKAASTKKTITNEDIGSSPVVAKEAKSASSNAGPDPMQTTRARQLLAEIRAKKTSVEGLQRQMAELKAEMQNGTNPPGRRMMQRLNNEYTADQQKLNREQTSLDELQEEARRMGFGNAAYDPD